LGNQNLLQANRRVGHLVMLLSYPWHPTQRLNRSSFKGWDD
jgi:hypothetical protein